MNFNLSTDRMMTLPVFVYDAVHADRRDPAAGSFDRAWAAALVLIIIVMVLNLDRAARRASCSHPRRAADTPATTQRRK